MATNRFRLGTRVKVVKNVGDSGVVLGKTGVVRDLEFAGDKDPSIGVVFPGWTGGHSLDGEGKNRGIRSGWYVYTSALQVIRKRKTVKR